MIDLHESDKRISELSGRIDFYSHLTPVNKTEEEGVFFEEIKKGNGYDPCFEYKECDLSEERRELEEVIKNLNGEDPVGKLLMSKALFLKDQLEFLSAEEDALGVCAVKIYGAPYEGCLKEAKEILESIFEEEDCFTVETVTPEEMVECLREYITSKGISWEVKLSNKIVPKVTVSGREGIIYINGKINYTVQEVERLKIHEVEVHIFRGVNGKKQPFRIFAEGTRGYNETEEGLAIIAEDTAGVLEVDTRQMKLYAGRAICADLCMKMSFFEAFKALRKYFPDEIAYRLVERAKRGLKDTSKRGCITKGFHYISGYRKIRNYLGSGGDLRILFSGKIGIDDVEVVRGLMEDGVLTPPDYLPDFLSG